MQAVQERSLFCQIINLRLYKNIVDWVGLVCKNKTLARNKPHKDLIFQNLGYE